MKSKLITSSLLSCFCVTGKSFKNLKKVFAEHWFYFECNQRPTVRVALTIDDEIFLQACDRIIAHEKTLQEVIV